METTGLGGVFLPARLQSSDSSGTGKSGRALKMLLLERPIDSISGADSVTGGRRRGANGIQLATCLRNSLSQANPYLEEQAVGLLILSERRIHVIRDFKTYCPQSWS